MQPDADYYEHWGFPVHNLPLPQSAVTNEDLSNVIKPVLQGCGAVLNSLVETIPNSTISTEDASTALALVAGQLAFALHTLARWEQHPHNQGGHSNGR